MFSESMLECLHELLIAIRNYDYSDDNRPKLIEIIMSLQEMANKYLFVEDSPKMLQNRPEYSRKIANEIYDKAIELRDTDSELFYE